MSAAKRRLRPGELDGLVLAYLREHAKDGPLTATSIAKDLGDRSAGAVANCLTRLAKDRKVRQAQQAPRAYVISKARAR
jgi:hypothetical protein